MTSTDTASQTNALGLDNLLKQVSLRRTQSANDSRACGSIPGQGLSRERQDRFGPTRVLHAGGMQAVTDQFAVRFPSTRDRSDVNPVRSSFARLRARGGIERVDLARNARG